MFQFLSINYLSNPLTNMWDQTSKISIVEACAGKEVNTFSHLNIISKGVQLHSCKHSALYYKYMLTKVDTISCSVRKGLV